MMMEEKRRSRIIDYHPASVDSDLDFTTANKIPSLFDTHSLVSHSQKANQEISSCRGDAQIRCHHPFPR